MRDVQGAPLHAGRNWGHDLYVLDTTHPAAAAYLTEVFTTLRAEGYDYFKVDFLYAGALEGVRHDGDGDERAALVAYRAGIALIREAIGPDAYLLGCAAPILPPSACSTRCGSVRTPPRTAVPRPATTPNPARTPPSSPA